MKDLKLIWNNEKQQGDISFRDGDFEREEGLATAVYLSLYLDRRADSDDVLDNPNDKRGWWGDLLETDGDQMGSKLWQVERAKTDQKTINKIKGHIEDALLWMITDGVASEIVVTEEREHNTDTGDKLFIGAEIYKGNLILGKFAALWTAQVGV